MKVTLESTTKIIEFRTPDGATVQARVWQGETAGGVKCHAYITFIAAATDQDHDEFDRDLEERAAPRPDVEALPTRMLI